VCLKTLVNGCIAFPFVYALGATAIIYNFLSRKYEGESKMLRREKCLVKFRGLGHDILYEIFRM
jgi:hypothetical protein